MHTLRFCPPSPASPRPTLTIGSKVRGTGKGRAGANDCCAMYFFRERTASTVRVYRCQRLCARRPGSMIPASVSVKYAVDERVHIMNHEINISIYLPSFFFLALLGSAFLWVTPSLLVVHATYISLSVQPARAARGWRTWLRVRCIFPPTLCSRWRLRSGGGRRPWPALYRCR